MVGGFGVLSLLGWHVGEGAHRAARAGVVVVAGDLGDPEVSHLQDVVLGDEHVGGLDVPVDDAAVVGDSQPLEDVQRAADGLARREGTPRLRDPEEAASGHALHDQERGLVVDSDVEDRHEVLVLEPRHRARLADEAPPDRRDREHLGVQELDGSPDVEVAVVGKEDARHPTGSQVGLESVSITGERVVHGPLTTRYSYQPQNEATAADVEGGPKKPPSGSFCACIAEQLSAKDAEPSLQQVLWAGARPHEDLVLAALEPPVLELRVEPGELRHRHLEADLDPL